MIKSAPLVESWQAVSCGNQKLKDGQIPSKMFPLKPHVVIEVLETMLSQEKQFSSDAVLHQEGIRLYRLIEQKLPFQKFRGVEMSPEIFRSLVLQALRKCGNSLGDETQFDKLFLAWSKG